MTNLVNPAANGGFNFGEILAQTLGTYQAVSLARIEKDTARFNAAGATQANALHAPQGYTMLESMGIGNSGQSSGSPSAAVPASIPQGLILGGLVVGAGLLVWNLVK